MRLTRITLPSPDVEACGAFFRDVMQLPVSASTVRVGWTLIHLVPGDADGGRVHLAFNVPPDRFDAACAWLRDRAMLLRDADGRECFEFGGVWDARSVYFAGPHGAVFELIARRPLAWNPPADGAFDGSEIGCVSEVGLPTDDVPALVRRLVMGAGIVPFGAVDEHFAPMGDYEGLLIAVDRRRPWFPEMHHLPGARGIRVLLEGVLPGMRFEDPDGWTVETTRPETCGNGSIPDGGARIRCLRS